MDFKVIPILVIDGELTIECGDVIRVTTKQEEVFQGTFQGANDFLKALTISRKSSEWSFDFEDIEELEIVYD